MSRKVGGGIGGSPTAEHCMLLFLSSTVRSTKGLTGEGRRKSILAQALNSETKFSIINLTQIMTFLLKLMHA